MDVHTILIKIKPKKMSKKISTKCVCCKNYVSNELRHCTVCGTYNNSFSIMDKYVVIGSSVALRSNGKTYTDLIKANNNVTDFSKTGLTIKDSYKLIDKIKLINPDYIILNIGIVDCCTRPYPKWMNDIIINTPIYKYIKKIFPCLVKIRGYKTRIQEREFLYYFIQLMSEFPDMIVLGITKTNKKHNKLLPGTRDNIIRYNKILKRSKAFIDLYDLDCPDGFHYTESSHKLIYKKIQDEKITNTRM